ncbi:hypothetical protein [Lewinella sp. W8]|uniref:hypothetical protein n=1 Tax=Lewinella sp. W8 TaxID=2528208 RepID=UPI0010674EA6|nr:hypothetical protein [Lewinella sp. W8]MTB49722.1 hypothetical protein [Lewinella sp. W8]
MSSRNDFDPAEFDRFAAAGQQKFENFAHSHRNVRRGLDAQFRKHRPLRYRTLFSIAASIIVVLVCAFLFRGTQQDSYLALADELRQPFSTETLSVKRGEVEPEISGGNQAALITKAMRLYHGGAALEAAELWHELAADADPDNQPLFQFYEGSAYWLGGAPQKAIQLLTPLLASLPTTDALYRKCHYVIGLAYLDNREPQKAIPHLEAVSGIRDKMGKATSRLLADLRKA